MARIPPAVLRNYLRGGQISSGGCLHKYRRLVAQSICSKRYNATQSPQIPVESAIPPVPLRKQLKDEAKKRKADGVRKKSKNSDQKLDNWELTVGIEIHAQLNTPRKLFSPALSNIDGSPNNHVAFFDVAMPGSQPTFQIETLIPAIRAALALNCTIQQSSRFDRKHYFHWDQPAGYQITQYYEPFAKDGCITLYTHDGIAKEDGEQVRIGIKQVQIEQDTAKTVSQPGDIHLLDFNRAGLPLIEIITLPQIHHPSTAAALVRKIQILLNSVDACVLGMQSGGLRADVNVSVRKRGSQANHEYAGVKGLGQRTEIKNLSSFKAVEDAIIAERDRQIEVLEAGGVIEGETRGWTIGSTETTRLRGKEGEVDYRYMPDADLGPVVIGEDLVNRLKTTLGTLPDEEIDLLSNAYGLTVKDAMSLVSLDDGGRVEYYYKVVDELHRLNPNEKQSRIGRLCGNWVLHEMGGLVGPDDSENTILVTNEGDSIIPEAELAQLIHLLDTNKITGKTAKKVLSALFEAGQEGSKVTTHQIVDQEGLWFMPLSDAEYVNLAESILDMNIVQEVLSGKTGKINYLLGQMMRKDADGRLDAKRATEVLWQLINEVKEKQDTSR